MAERVERLKIQARGAVQGVGFRPFVYNLATDIGLYGYVLNSPQGATVEVEGPSDLTDCFLLRLRQDLPSPAFLTGLETQRLDLVGYREFVIRESEETGAKTAVVLPDIATCPQCLEELF